MSFYDYQASKQIPTDSSFYSCIMAAMSRADTFNLALLRDAWPEVWAELDARYNAPGGAIPGDAEYETVQAARRRWAETSAAEPYRGVQIGNGNVQSNTFG